MRRKDREVSDKNQIEDIMKRCIVCHIGLCDDAIPYIVPVHFGYADGFIYFHSAPEGKKMEMIRKNNRVCFQMETNLQVLESDKPCHWSTKYESVIGSGMATLIYDKDEKGKALKTIFRHYSSASCDLSESEISKVAVVKIQIESLSAKVSAPAAPQA